MPLKLHYFAAPARAEVARLCLTLGGIPFEDVHYDFKTTWPEFKPKTPFGQIPVLELEDGKMLAQSAAINNYTAKLAGLFPQDPWAAALADQAIATLEEVLDPIYATMRMETTEEKIKARQDLLAGTVKTRLENLSKLVEHGFVAGDKLSHADLYIFHILSMLSSGTLDGVPLDLLDHYPALKAHRNKVANVPEVKKHYEHVTEGSRVYYKPNH